MDTIEAIMTRRSIRKYTPDEVDDKLVTILLEAAMQAPSAGNSQPWHFVVIRDRQILDEIPRFHQNAQMIDGVSVAIAVCADTENEKYKGRWMLDCSAATQNILLAAHSFGLGAVWVGIYPVAERIIPLKKLLNLPENIIPVSLLPIGFPDEKKAFECRFKPDRIHYNRWDEKR